MMPTNECNDLTLTNNRELFLFNIGNLFLKSTQGITPANSVTSYYTSD